MSEEGKGEGTPQKAVGAPEPADKKRKNKWLVLGVIVAVLVVAGVGFNIWHEQPSFCNTVCHAPMDNYVASYTSDDPGMLVTPHAKAGVNCLDCHNPKMSEQLTEVVAWTSDTFPVDEQGNLVYPDAENMASPEFCLKSGCHDWNDVVNSTWGFAGNDAKYNPHSSHQDGAVQCGDCHKSHSTSTLYCGKCHALNLPEGWENTHDAD